MRVTGVSHLRSRASLSYCIGGKAWTCLVGCSWRGWCLTDRCSGAGGTTAHCNSPKLKYNSNIAFVTRATISQLWNPGVFLNSRPSAKREQFASELRVDIVCYCTIKIQTFLFRMIQMNSYYSTIPWLCWICTKFGVRYHKNFFINLEWCSLEFVPELSRFLRNEKLS